MRSSSEAPDMELQWIAREVARHVENLHRNGTCSEGAHHCMHAINKEAVNCSGKWIPSTNVIVSYTLLLLRIKETGQSTMQVINWSELQPPPVDLEALREPLRKALPLRRVCRLLVETTLRAYPWAGRADLVPCYHPSQTYKPGQKIALLIPDRQKARRTVWLLAQVNGAKWVENPIQGRFQALSLELHGRQIQMAGGVVDASYPEPRLSHFTSEDFAWLVGWISSTYAAALQATVKKLIQTGQILGQLAGETFLPEQLLALSPELLQPVFTRISAARPWISLEQIYHELPDLSRLERKTVLALLRATLKESSYRSLGGDRWTTHELFTKLNREVPRGLPTPPIRSKVPIWTKRDEQDLAGYDSQFLPLEARGMLAELGFGERPAERKAFAWHSPNDPLQLPALHYLHITQGYFPVCSALHFFAPDVEMVFIQFLHGTPEPFLLDREHGLLKAIHPEELYTRALEEDMPAGTSLWLEYQGRESYRIAPRPLPFKRRVPGKLAYLEGGRLHIEHTYLSMRDAGNPSLFRANLRFEEIGTLFAEASRSNRSVRDAIVYAVQEICGTDPDHRAHWLDIFNAVFLQRTCSPTSVALLLYTQACFESLGGGYFRYKPMPDTVNNTDKQTDRLSRLWDDLLSNPVAPHPSPKERMTVRARSEVRYPVAASFLSPPDTEVPVGAASYAAQETAGLIEPNDGGRMEPVLLSNYEPEQFTATDGVNHTWRESFKSLLSNLVELEDAETSASSAEEANSGGEAFSDASVGAAHEASLSFSSPFRWEPKPAWIYPPTQTQPPLPEAPNPRRFVYNPKIPLRPFHKQRLYRRAFFYFRNWLRIAFEKKL